MNPENQPDWETEARKVEVEIDPIPAPLPTTHRAPQNPDAETGKSLPPLGLQVRSWFANLPQGGKAIAIVVCVLVAVSLLKTVLQLVSALASLAIAGILLFAVYKLLIAPQSSQS
ncbi:hypothetical protein [Oscillatoria sp. FACHB-1406]|uniref:hypothetical protein n=1 Tax=Oscillatoria sp. FACHB-1406 TaxID=2692846 RepID=UPI001686E713|nr:hypothetical protein [Oscillatoria sp. FACHB-1406]MBD2578303.1 hypothetical protein [Oscillatoria sp. FACHB-1406]